MARTQLFGVLKRCAALAWSAERAGMTTDLQVERLWTRWVLITPIFGLIILGYSLKNFFTR